MKDSTENGGKGFAAMQETIGSFYEKYITRTLLSDVAILLEHYLKLMSIYLIESANL